MPIQGQTAATRAANRRRKATDHAVMYGAAPPKHDHDADWEALLAHVQATFNAARKAERSLFTTDAADQFGTFLHHVRDDEKQVHTCRTCARFFELYGGLVTIAPDGITRPALWDADRAPEFYRRSIEAVAGYVSRAKVTGVFLSADRAFGPKSTRAGAKSSRSEWLSRSEWTHFSVERAFKETFQHLTLSPFQAMAEKAEDFKNVSRALADFPPTLLKEALRLLNADALNRSEHFVGPVEWLLDLHWESASAPGKSRDSKPRTNRIWRAVAVAPAGFCHPRSGVIGTLLEDLKAGLPFEDVRRKFNVKVHGLNYQRSKAAPAAGNIVQAEKLVEKLGIAASLHRRFARLDELETIWLPIPNWREALLPGLRATGGVFSHLKAKGAVEPRQGIDLPAQKMTWVKFRDTVLPSAREMKVHVRYRGNFTAVLTAVDPEAPLLLKWNNPFSVYLYHPASLASDWGLAPSTWVKVTGLSLRPNMWGDNPQPHLGEGALFFLDGAVDQRAGNGNAIFPANVREELHSVRSTIEAFSKNAEIGGREQASACGLSLGKSGLDALLRVTSEGGDADYIIDRWD